MGRLRKKPWPCFLGLRSSINIFMVVNSLWSQTTNLLGPTAEIPPIAAAQMQRWGIFLSAYQYDVEYKRSKEHGNADGLSRLPLPPQLDQGQ